MRTARPGFSGQGSRDVATGDELAYLMLFGNRSFGVMKDDQAAYDFFKRCMEVHNWWLTTREVLAERQKSASESSACKNPNIAAKNPDICQSQAMAKTVSAAPPSPVAPPATAAAAVQSPAPAIQTKVEAPSLLGQVYLVKGPVVSNPPQAFRAKFTDGKAEIVLSGNRLLTGDVETLPTDQSIKAKYQPRLLRNPDNLQAPRGANAKGFAALSDGTGTEIECAYMINPSNGRGEGVCADNQRNTYRLVFD